MPIYFLPLPSKMNAVLMLMSVVCSPFLVAAALSDCKADQMSSLRFQCRMELKSMDDFKEAPFLDSLMKSNPEHHKIGCCMERALAKCYRKTLTGDCAGFVDGLIRNNQDILNQRFDGRKCDYQCSDGSNLLKPTWALVTVLVMCYVLERKL